MTICFTALQLIWCFLFDNLKDNTHRVNKPNSVVLHDYMYITQRGFVPNLISLAYLVMDEYKLYPGTTA